MKQLQSNELNKISGGEFDWKVLPVAGGWCVIRSWSSMV